MSKSESKSVLKPSIAYKPHLYEWASILHKKQRQVIWHPEEIPMTEDIKQWKDGIITDSEKNFLTNIFRFFTQADVDVGSAYVEKYLPKFKSLDIRMMLSMFAAMETIHIEAYALLIETLGLPDTEFNKFMEYDVMVNKHKYLNEFNVDTERDTLKTLAIYGAFIEGLQLFGSFAMLLNFQRQNKMMGMCSIVSWSVRDEAIHTEGILRLFWEYAKETGLYDDKLKNEIRDCAKEVVNLENKFIDLAFEMGDLKNLTKKEIKDYIKYLCDFRLSQLEIKPLFNIKKDPIPWLQEIMSGVEHANFFEVRSTEYSSGATKGSWKDTWESFDKNVNVNN